MVLNFKLNPIHPGLFSFLRPDEGFGAPLYNFKAAQDMATKTNENNVLAVCSSFTTSTLTCFKHFTHTLTNKETRTKTLKEFKRYLVKFDTDKMHFDPILATTKNRDIGSGMLLTVLIFNCTFSRPILHIFNSF